MYAILKLPLAVIAVSVFVAGCGEDPKRNRRTEATIEVVALPEAVQLEAEEDTPLRLSLAEAFGEGADAYAYHVKTKPEHGKFSISEDGIAYEPAPDYSGDDALTLRAVADDESAREVKLTISVASANDAPVGKPASFNGTEDSIVHGALKATDIDSSALTFALAGNGTKGTAKINADGSFVYTPAVNADGKDTFRFTVSDGKTKSKPAQVTINLAPVNDAPTATGAAIDTLEDTLLTDMLPAFDPDTPHELLTYNLVTQATRGTVDLAANGTFTYHPQMNVTGSDSFGFNVSDGEYASATVTVLINILNVNDTPQATATWFVVNEDELYTGQVFGTDIDGDELTFSLASNGAHGMARIESDGSFTYRGAFNYHGSDSFTFTASDGHIGGSYPATVTVVVKPVNDAPYYTAKTWSVNEDTILTGQATGVDVDGDTLTYALETQATKGTVSLQSNGEFFYQPQTNANGSDKFTVSVTDGKSAPVTHTYTINVIPVNDAPVCAAMTPSVDEDGELTLTPAATDVDGDTLTISQVSGASNGTLTLTDGVFTYKPNANYFGSDSWEYSASDGSLACNSAKVTVTVNSVNDRPVVTSTNFSWTINEDTSKSGVVTGTDIEGDPLTWKVGQTPAHGTVAFVGSTFTYTPAWDYSGNDTFTVVASDGKDDSANFATVAVKISPSNDTPFGYSKIIQVASPSGTYGGQVTATDADGDSITYKLIGSSTKLVVSSDGSFTYTGSAVPEESWEAYSIQASDGKVPTTFSLVVKVGACTDADGDGFGVSCLAGADCNDNDATIYNGAPELPDDGIAQSCTADLVAGNSTGVFVSPTGSDLNAGTKEAPVATLSRALSLSGGLRAVFVAAGTYVDDNGATAFNVTSSLFGGYNAADWSRDIAANPTVIARTDLEVPVGPVAIQGFKIKQLKVVGTAHLVDNTIGLGGTTQQYVLRASGGKTIAVRNRILGDDIHYTRALYSENAASVVLVDNDIYPGDGNTAYSYGVELRASGNATLDRNRLYTSSVTGWAVVPFSATGAAGKLTMRNNLFDQSPIASSTIDITAPQMLVFLNNTIDGKVAISGSGLGVIANNIMLDGFSLQQRSVYLMNNLILPLSNGYPLQANNRNVFFGLNEVNACRFSECAASSGNIGTNPAFLPGGFIPSFESPAINAGIDPLTISPYFENGVDIDGVARPLGAAWDIGAWEIQ